MKARFLISMTGALALAACGSGDNANQTADNAEADAAATPAAQATPAGTTPQAFIDAMASSDMYEIEAGKLAQDMGTSDKVKSFGAMMEKDHTASSAKLKDAATQSGGLKPAATMMPKHQQNLDALKSAGDQFDKLYAQQQVAAHQEALGMLEGYAGNGSEEPLKAFASATAPVVEGHLAQARELP